ncbi:STAS domain-containing protein [Nocardioides ferulae]|uniref:STAS domain-containing protein n=1 Tax=Nocardioides ferulae TaxID=2340821 RepID=UPI000EAD83B8|nr:STAS domain-containing protein [Nocardioides ferulae]
MTRSPLFSRTGRHLSVVTVSDRCLLRFDGELDVARIDDIERQVTGALAEGHREIELDLGDVTFMDCATIGTLISCVREARAAGGTLQICAASPAARRVIDLTRTGDALGLAPAA